MGIQFNVRDGVQMLDVPLPLSNGVFGMIRIPLPITDENVERIHAILKSMVAAQPPLAVDLPPAGLDTSSADVAASPLKQALCGLLCLTGVKNSNSVVANATRTKIFNTQFFLFTYCRILAVAGREDYLGAKIAGMSLSAIHRRRLAPYALINTRFRLTAIPH